MLGSFVFGVAARRLVGHVVVPVSLDLSLVGIDFANCHVRGWVPWAAVHNLAW